MSDAESLNSDDSQVNASAPKILSAVRSYLLDRSFAEKPNSIPSQVIANDSGYIRRLSERFTPLQSGVHTPMVDVSSHDMDESMLSILRDNNVELSFIRDILCKSIPDALNETLLLVVEERSRRERIEAELQAIRERWKQDVSDLQKIIEAKSQTITHLVRLNSGGPVIDIGQDLQIALSEIERLRTIIKTIR